MTDQLLFPGMSAPRLTDGLFFALFPDAAVAARIGGLTRQLRDAHALSAAPHAADRLHVSLHGLGEYPAFPKEIAARATAAAAAVALPPFEIAFDRALSFSGKPGQLPLVLRSHDGAAGVTALQQALGTALAKAGLAARPSTPHLTLLYDARRVGEQAIDSVGWTVRDFVLVHSLLGQTRYIPLGKWPLRG